jgi:hypothetical protein
MNNNSLIIFGGVFHLGFVVFHLFFWQLFKWRPARLSEYISLLETGKESATLIYVNRAVTQILNLCLTFVFIVVAYISLFYSSELLSSSLGRVLIICISVFWFLRTIEQLVFFGLKRRLSVVLTFLFVIGFLIYLIPFITEVLL